MKIKNIQRNIVQVGRGLNDDNKLSYVWGKVAKGAHACMKFTENGSVIYLPLIDQSKCTDEQFNDLIAFDRHERLHSIKSCPKFFRDDSNNLKGIELTLLQRIEDSRIEGGNLDLTAFEVNERKKNGIQFSCKETGNDAILHSVRIKHALNVINKREKMIKGNPLGYLAFAVQYHISGYMNLEIPEHLKSLYDAAIEILEDGRFEESKFAFQEGTWTSAQLAKEIALKWKEEQEEQEEEQQQEEDNASQDTNKSEEDQEQEFEELDTEVLGRMVDNIEDFQIVNKINPKINDLEYNMEDKDVVPNEFPNEFLKQFSQIQDKTSFLKAKLHNLLLSITKEKRDTQRKSGKLVARKLYNVSVGKTNIFEKKINGKNIDTAIGLVIDLSGSMSYPEKNQTACQTLIALAEALNSIPGISIEIVGFNSLYTEKKYTEDSYKYMKRPSDKVMTYFFKKYNENYHNIKNRLGSVVVSIRNNGSLGGANVDHEVIKNSAYRLSTQKQKRKLQFVISDGLPSGHSCNDEFLQQELIKVNEIIVKSGIEQIGIGVLSDSVEKFYKNNVVINNINELNDKVLLTIADFLLKK